jgi:cell shape-determining protein MreC
MTYLRANKRPAEKRNRVIYSIVAFLIFVMILVQIFFPHFLPSIFTSIFKPFWTARISVTAGSLDSRDTLILENEDLKRKIQEYEVRLSTISSIEEENVLLKEIFGRPEQKNAMSTSSRSISTSTENVEEKYDYSFVRQRANGRILSAVLIRPPFTGYDEYIIDIGKDFGVNVNDKVYAPGDVLIGRVVDVLSDTAKVVLHSSPGQKYEVTVGDNKDIATAVGRGGGQYEVVMSRDAVVKDGDFVLAPSVSDKPFGVVTAVLSDPAEPFETVLFASTVSIYNIRWVMVEVK